MSLCVQLELKNRKVLIVGGGHVALRKTKLFLREGAKVTIVALDILKELYALAQCHKRAFTQDDVLDAFLVVAASNDAEVNGKVRQAAQQANVLFMNVEADSQSDVHAMSYIEDAYYALAFTTKGNCPSYAKQVLESFNAQLKQHHVPYLKALKTLRAAILRHVKDGVKKHALLEALMTMELPLLQFLAKAYLQQRACVLVYHGVTGEKAQEEIALLLQELSFHQPAMAFGYAYLSKRILSQVNDERTAVFSCRKLLAFLQDVSIPVQVVPMFLQEGHFYEEAKQLAYEYHASILPLPYATKDKLHALLQHLYDTYHKEGTKLLITFHASEDSHFEKRCHAICAEMKDMTCCDEKQSKQLEETTQSYPLYMLYGKHASATSTKRISCMSDKILRKQLFDHIMSMLQEKATT